MGISFVVATKSDSHLEEAIQSYVFNLFALGLEVPKSSLNIVELESRVYEAFKGLLEDYVVSIDVEADKNTVSINLY